MLGEFKRLDVPHQKSVVPELIGIYLEDAPIIMTSMKEAFERRDLKAIASAAHKLHGSSSLFGAVKVRVLCLQIEKAARVGAMEEIFALMPQVNYGVARTCEQLLEELAAFKGSR